MLLAFILIVYFVIAASALALRVRRFHDAGFSGWFVLLDFFPYGSVVTFVFSILPSQKKNNKYGPSPENLAKMLSGELPADWEFSGMNPQHKNVRPPPKMREPYVDTQFISNDDWSHGGSDDMAGNEHIVRKNNWDNNDGGQDPGGDPSEYD